MMVCKPKGTGESLIKYATTVCSAPIAKICCGVTLMPANWKPSNAISIASGNDTSTSDIKDMVSMCITS